MVSECVLVWSLWKERHQKSSEIALTFFEKYNNDEYAAVLVVTTYDTDCDVVDTVSVHLEPSYQLKLGVNL
jgi:hypothetical protein